MYACTARTNFGARCRNLEVSGTGFCPQHSAGATVIGQPDDVLYKFNVNPNWTKRLQSEGVEFRHPNWEQRIAKHIAQAEAVGRNAHSQREGIEDSGVAVFGKEGLINVEVFELFKELVDAYEIVDICLEPMRPGKNQTMNKLVVYFGHGESRAPNTLALNSLLEFLASGCWGHCHVWANPPGGNGRIKDTVNISHRQPDKQPERVLRFANGLWQVEELVPAA